MALRPVGASTSLSEVRPSWVRALPARWSFSFVVLLVFVATLPLGVSRSFGPLDLVHVTLCVTVAVTALLRLAGGALPWRWHPSAAWLLLLLVLLTMSTVTARDTAFATRALITIVLGMLLALTVHTLCDTADRWRDLVTVLVLVGIVGALYGLVTVGVLRPQFPGGGALSGRAEGIFNQPNQLGTFSAVLLLVGCGQALGGRTRVESALGVACTLLSATTLLVSFSRGAWIGAVLGTVVLVLCLTGRQRRWFLTSAAVLLLMGTPLTLLGESQVPSLVGERITSIVEPDLNPDDSRPLIYEEAVRQLTQRPVLGQGPGNFEPASHMAENLAGGVEAWHAHNLALQVAAEAGLPALTALGAFGVSLAWRVLRTRAVLSASDSALALGLACGMAAVVGQGLVDFTLGNPILAYLVWTCLGALLAVTGRGTTWSRTTRREAGPT